MQDPIRFKIVVQSVARQLGLQRALVGDEHRLCLHACPTAIRILICAAAPRLLDVSSSRRDATAGLMVPRGSLRSFQVPSACRPCALSFQMVPVGSMWVAFDPLHPEYQYIKYAMGRGKHVRDRVVRGPQELLVATAMWIPSALRMIMYRLVLHCQGKAW